MKTIDLTNLVGYEIKNDDEIIDLIDKKEITITQEIKNIPNQVENLKLVEYSSENSENIQYLKLRYIFKDKTIKGVYSFSNRYHLSLKKNLTSKYGINQILYIKEPFIKDIKDKTFYKYDDKDLVKNTKFTHQRFMKQTQARYFIQVKDIVIEKSKRDLCSYNYMLKFKCVLVDNPLKKDFIPTNKTNFFYRVQIPDINEETNNTFIYWKDFEVGYVEAKTKKEAREILEDRFNCTLPSKVINKDFIGSKYKYILKVYDNDEYYNNFWYGEKECEICGKSFRIADKINIYGSKGGGCCSLECDSLLRKNKEALKEIEYINAKFEVNNGIHLPCIYKITNKTNDKCYIGQTTQAFTFRWYQHFSSPKDTKFHNAILETDITDWNFEVLEMIDIKKLDLKYDEKRTYISKREQHYIHKFNSIKNGYNTATANKEEDDLQNSLFGNFYNDSTKQ